MLDIEELMKDNFYVPIIPLKEGLRRTYKWYQEKKPIINDSKMSKVDELVKK